MKGRLALAVWMAAAGLLAACDGGKSSSPPVGPDLRGHWTGQYDNPTSAVPLAADISQDGNSLVIETTMTGNGHLMTGTISTNGAIYIMDAFTGKTWTSFGDPTPHHIFIRDYLTVNQGIAGGVQSMTLDR